MAKLTTSARKSIPASKFGLPEKAPGRGSYPMPDAKHAAIAKAYASRFASPSQEKRIDAKANQVLRHPHANLGGYLHPKKGK